MKTKLVNENFKENYLSNLLVARGVEDVEKYINPTSDYLLDPSLLKNIAIASALYLRVVLQPRSRILLIVDPDVDGFTSAAIIYQYTHMVNCHCQIDYWLHEGKAHGLQDHIDKLMTENVQYDLIILPDSSSNDLRYHDMLEEIHIPCLVLDHHITDVQFSENAIVVNNQTSPNYSNKDLTGAGVVYQFCRYIDGRIQQNWANNFIDLAAVGGIGDMGSVLNTENRYIIYKGLLKENIKNDFLKCLLNTQAYSITGAQSASWDEIVEKTNPITIAFYIVPMINAMIRVGTMEEKNRLFQAFIDGSQLIPSGKRGAKGTLERNDIESARECTNAKNRQNRIKEDVVASLENKIYKYDLLENKVLFINLEDTDCFPSELTGLVAMQLSSKFKKPTIVARENSEGYVRGSIRGLNQSALTSFKKFLEESNMFEYVSGHDNAAGCSISSKKIEEFHRYANEALKDIDFGENYYDINFKRSGTDEDISQLIVDLAKGEKLWGQNNPQPMIYIDSIKATPNNIRIMGKNSDTVKIEYNGISYIKFHAKDLIQALEDKNNNCSINIIGKPNLNEWGGRITPQIFVEVCELK